MGPSLKKSIGAFFWKVFKGKLAECGWAFAVGENSSDIIVAFPPYPFLGGGLFGSNAGGSRNEEKFILFRRPPPTQKEKEHFEFFSIFSCCCPV